MKLVMADVKSFFDTLGKDVTQEMCSRSSCGLGNVLQTARRGRRE